MTDSDARQNRETINRMRLMFRDVSMAVATEALRSVQEGSELTGAPGQPVDTGNLRASWQMVPGAESIMIGTNVEYAEAIEDGVGKYGPLTLRSQVGGWHSVKQTAANMDRIVDAVTRSISRDGLVRLLGGEQRIRDAAEKRARKRAKRLRDGGGPRA